MQTDRLDMIIKYVNRRSVADIGTDHAYIPVELSRRNMADVIIATDVRPGPLEAAKRSVERAGVRNVTLRLGSGLSPIAPGECENIIIAGMGAELICTILDEGKACAKAAQLLLLQPMNAQYLLRKYLGENGYDIVGEDIMCEGFKVYNLILAKSGRGFVWNDEFELHLPEYLRKHKNFPALLAKKRREFSKILTGLEKAQEKDEEEIKRYAYLLKRTEELM